MKAPLSVSVLIAIASVISIARADDSLKLQSPTTSANAELSPPLQSPGFLSVTLHYSDLDLSRPENIAILYRRIGAAAKRVCTPFESRELSLRGRWLACMNGAVSRAVGQMAIPSLSALANARGIGTGPTVLAAKTR